MSLRLEKVEADKQRGVKGSCLIVFHDGKEATFYAVEMPEDILIRFSDSCVLAHEFGHVLLGICLASYGKQDFLFRYGLDSGFLKAHEILAWSIAKSLSPAYEEEKALFCLSTHSYACMKPEEARLWLSKPLLLTKEEIVRRFFEVAQFFNSQQEV